MPSLIQQYEKSPNKWNVSLMITIGGILYAAAGMFLSSQFEQHSNDEYSHPVMTQQLDRLEANQVMDRIEKMDERICEEPTNNYYREQLRKLIIEWEKITGKTYPTQLLRCANGNP